MTCGRVLDNCIFCGAAETTEEHIVADWVLRAFLKSKKAETGFSGSHVDGDEWRLTAGEAVTTAKVVCQPCNNGWLSRLDEAAADALKPLVHGQTSVALNADAQSAVSAWIFKCALIFDVSQSGEHGSLSTLRGAFARDRLAPPGTTIYAGPAPPTPFTIDGIPEVAGLLMFGVRPTSGTFSYTLNIEHPDGTTTSMPPKQLLTPGWTVMLGRVQAIISGLRGPIVPTPEWDFKCVWPPSEHPVTLSSRPAGRESES
jgi:hypothetical protein